jgi:hypothetical protein
MIGEIDPRAYDCEGRAMLEPRGGRWLPSEIYRPFLAGDLTVRCGSLDEIRAFLRQCRYVSDPNQFSMREYWMHPRHFERLRRGDCEDFAFWTWRQLLAMKLDARFVLGQCGRGGHAWVTFADSQTHYLFEPTAPRRPKLSRLDLLRYKPECSIAVCGGRLVYHRHEPRVYKLTTSDLLELARSLPLSLICLPWYLVKWAARWMRSRDLKWQEITVTVDNSLPDSEPLIHRLLESGIPVSGEIEDPSKPPARKKRLAVFGDNVPPERIRDVIHAAGDYLDLIQITEHASSIVYIGRPRSRAIDEPMAELTPELKAVLLKPKLSTEALRARIASLAVQERPRRG